VETLLHLLYPNAEVDLVPFNVFTMYTLLCDLQSNAERCLTNPRAHKYGMPFNICQLVSSVHDRQIRNRTEGEEKTEYLYTARALIQMSVCRRLCSSKDRRLCINDIQLAYYELREAQTEA
jgi:hypothetical protein